MTDRGTTTTLKAFVTARVVESVSTPSQDADVWSTIDPITFGEDIDDDVSEISESAAESVSTSASGYCHTSSGKFTLIPIMLSLQKIQNVDDSAFNHWYDTDNYIGPFYASIEHEEEMGVKIKEDPMPSKEEFDAFAQMAEDPVCANIDDTTVADGSIERDELGKTGLVKRHMKPEFLHS
eukprot:14269052-Ditylum_brightwellii.AAC.1